MRSSRLASFIAGGLAVLVIGSGASVAATGGSFILGRSNSATTTTTLSNSKGTALTLKAPSNKPVMTVSNRTRVPNLDADRLDGLDSMDFASRSGGTGRRIVRGLRYSLDPADNGAIDMIGGKAQCPDGSRLTGGGYEDNTATGIVVMTEPTYDNTAWQVMVAIDPTYPDDQNGEVLVFAQCYDPRGAIGSQYDADHMQPPLSPSLALSSDERQLLVARADARK